MEQQLPASLRERQIAEFVEHDEILAAQIVSQAPRPSGAALGLKSVDQIDDIEEAAASTATNAGASEWDGSEDGRVPLLVIDGQEVSWDELGRMLMSFEGWQFRLAICDRSEEV